MAEGGDGIDNISVTNAAATVAASGGAMFEAFLDKNAICVKWYERQAQAARKCPRYVRIDARCMEAHEVIAAGNGSSIDLVEAQGCTVKTREGENDQEAEEKMILPLIVSAFPQAKPVKWLPTRYRFMALPPDSRLKGSDLYESGILHGIDAASGFCVAALGPLPGERVLDIACAPGAKFCLIADVMQRQGTLVGIDAAPARAQTCVSLCKKYRVCQARKDTPSSWDCTVVIDDGVSFSNVWESKKIAWCSDADRTLFAEEDKGQGTGRAKRKRLSKAMKKHLDAERSAKRSKNQANSNPIFRGGDAADKRDLFDRVLVDAECTHDGSLKHMEKYAQGGFFGQEQLEQKFINADNAKYSDTAASLQDLQRGLLSNGFRLLRPGGTLVYATCSFCPAQNEDIVRWLLTSFPEKAKLVPLGDEPISGAGESHPGVASAKLPGTLAFLPLESNSSGMYIARLTKVAGD